jgi:predicted signal transduction protein with EAL and GGDEF domain
MRLTTSDDRFGVPSQGSATWSAALVVGALLVIFVVDRATDSAPVQHLYYLPIILAGLRFKMRGGVLSALSAILLYHVANPHLFTLKYGEPDLVQIALFLAVGIITANTRQNADRLHRLAMTDDLTGLHNLRSFEARLVKMVRASCGIEAPLALLVLDVDHLKSLNDRYGHLPAPKPCVRSDVSSVSSFRQMQSVVATAATSS